MKLKSRRGAMLVGLGVAGTAAAFYVWRRPAPDDSLARIQRAGVLRAGYSVEAPYALVRADGSVTGESPETALRIAARLKIPRVEWIQAPFAQQIARLDRGTVDMLACGLFVTPERARQVRFSDPTVKVRAGLLVRRGNPAGLQGYAQAAQAPGARIAVVTGTVEVDRLRRFGLPPARTVPVPDAQAGVSAVALGEADALALSLPAVRWTASRRPADFEAIADEPAPGQGAPREDWVAFAFRPADTELHAAWNRAQAGWIGGPEHFATVVPFGFSAEDLAEGQPLDAVLGR
jgi:polar amino acid transport system substrate-binding protein